jgi:outer membrane lipoprotein-sorting protein
MRQLTAVGIVCLLVGGIIGLSHHTACDPEAKKLLKAATQAPETQEYIAQATTFATYGNRLLHSEAEVYNARGGKYRIEYKIGSLSGVIVGRSEPDMTWRYDPLHRRLITEKLAVSQADPNHYDLNMLLKNCRAKVKMHTTVAGRPATEIVLEPKAGGGSRTLWIDPETGVILRSEERNVENDLVAATTFHSITYGKTASPEQFLPIPPTGKPIKWIAENDFAREAGDPRQISRTIGVPLMEPKYIPTGYQKEGYYLYNCPGCASKAAITRYVDGLNSLTVVQSSSSCEHHMESQPLDFGLGKAVSAKHGDSIFWVLGELPRSELEKVSNSLGTPAKA